LEKEGKITLRLAQNIWRYATRGQAIHTYRLKIILDAKERGAVGKFKIKNAKGKSTGEKPTASFSALLLF
jgi:hypothetical protein